jgi:hypothetical protein
MQGIRVVEVLPQAVLKVTQVRHVLPVDKLVSVNGGVEVIAMQSAHSRSLDVSNNLGCGLAGREHVGDAVLGTLG